MVVKVIIKRKIREGKAREVFALLNKFRSDAMNQKGYISGETLFNHDNPLEIVVISMWQGVENWLKWKDDPERKANEARLEQWLEGPTEYDTYVFGTYYTQFAK
ncbi:MAG: antibiotic biosynthesis monooxygenase [Desulfobacterales bacterium]|nr:antibiotic biosynthesis monooxygenase [Desulfobacterales bacterium]